MGYHGPNIGSELGRVGQPDHQKAAKGPSCSGFTIPKILLMPPGSCVGQNARNKIQFNGVGGLRTYISFTHVEQRIGQNMKILAQRKDPRGDLIPVIVTVFVAVAGTAGILLNNFGSGNDSQGSGDARTITAAAVSRAGAIEIPSEPPARWTSEGVSA
jgi:hypothetical protein